MVYVYIVSIDGKYYIMDVNTTHDFNKSYLGLYSLIDIEINEIKPYLGTHLDKCEHKDNLIKGIVAFKKIELSNVSKSIFNKYIESREDNYEYYQLQEKEVDIYKKTNKSLLLSTIADRKNIKVNKLIDLINSKIELHKNIILKFKYNISDLMDKLDALNLIQLDELCILDFVNSLLIQTDE